MCIFYEESYVEKQSYVNEDVIFLFTFYKHRHKQISAVILKPNIEVTSSTRYLYKTFLSFDSSYIYYLRKIYDFWYVRVLYVIYARKSLRTHNLLTETGVRTFVNGSKGQYASSCQMLYRSVKPLPRYCIFKLLGCRPPPTRELEKRAYYENYCIDSNQILHSDKNHQTPFVGGPHTCITNSRWRMAVILEKSKNHQYLRPRQAISTKFGTVTLFVLIEKRHISS